MPSWNIHTAIVEDLLRNHDAASLGIVDANAFLFGNYVPDIYVGFMVPDATLHIDYCMTHVALPSIIPVPNADFFWDHYVGRRKRLEGAKESLVLGAWAHLVADRFYNGRFRTFYETHELPMNESLRIGKQGDFDLFGRSLSMTSHVDVTPELLEAAQSFMAYTVLPDDVRRSVDVASAIVDESGIESPANEDYQLLTAEWMQDALDACVERQAVWFKAWQQLRAEGARYMSSDIRSAAGLPPAMSDSASWRMA